MSKHPNIKWAQRKGRVFVEVQIRDAKNEKVELNPNSLVISGESDGVNYAASLELFGEVIPDQSKWTKNGQGISILLIKKEVTAEYWPRLVKQAAKNQYITCDWARWIDEEDEAEEGNKGLEGYDPSAYQNFNDSDSDDEKGNLDDLDKG